MSSQLTSPPGTLRGSGNLTGTGRLRASRRFARVLRLVIPLLLVLLLLPLLFGFLSGPRNLREAILIGPAPDAPTRLVIVLDVSASMEPYWGAREQAIRELITWTTGNLRPTDTMAIYAFATDGGVILPETTVGELSRTVPNLREPTALGGSTELDLLLSLLGQTLGPEPHVIAWITDTEIVPISHADVLRTTADINVVSTTTVTPRNGHTARWSDAFPGSHYVTASPSDSDELALALAQTIANATGQKIARR